MTTATFDDKLEQTIKRFRDNEQSAWEEYVRLLRMGAKLTDDEADRMFTLAREVLGRSTDDIQADRAQLLGDQADRETIDELDALRSELQAKMTERDKAAAKRDKFLKSLKAKEKELRVEAAIADGAVRALERRINQKENYEQRRVARREKFPELMRAAAALE